MGEKKYKMSDVWCLILDVGTRSNIDTLKFIDQLYKEAKDEHEKIDIRLRLRAQVIKIYSSIQIYPLMEKHPPIQGNRAGYYPVHQ